MRDDESFLNFYFSHTMHSFVYWCRWIEERFGFRQLKLYLMYVCRDVRDKDRRSISFAELHVYLVKEDKQDTPRLNEIYQQKASFHLAIRRRINYSSMKIVVFYVFHYIFTRVLSINWYQFLDENVSKHDIPWTIFNHI